MRPWKLPSKAKIYEALTAMSSKRVTISGNTAQVVSSDKAKTYTVEWNDDLSQITANDNGSFWQGYMGYPILAILMLKGKISYHPSIATRLANINWKKVNQQFHNNYDKAVDHVLSSMSKRQEVETEVTHIYNQLKSLHLSRLPSGRKPPKS